MTDSDATRHDGRRLSFLNARLPAWANRRVVVLLPGVALDVDQTDWKGALVVVERGTVDLECHAGGRRSFSVGDLFWLAGLPIRALHNTGPEPAVLVAVSRE